MENNYFNNKLSFSIKIDLGFGGGFLDTVLACVEKQGGFLTQFWTVRKNPPQMMTIVQP